MCLEFEIDFDRNENQIEQKPDHLLLIEQFHHLVQDGNQFEPVMMFVRVHWTEHRLGHPCHWLGPLREKSHNFIDTLPPGMAIAF